MNRNALHAVNQSMLGRHPVTTFGMHSESASDLLLPVTTVRYTAALQYGIIGFDYSADFIVQDDTMVFKALELLTASRLFRRERGLARTWDIIVWWESRRIPYNLIVGATGVVSAFVILLTGLVTAHLTGDAIGVSGSPLFEIFAVIIYGIMANICFTGGWVLELFSRRIWGARAEAFGEMAFTWGMLGSVLLTLVPAAIVVGFGAYRIIAHGWN